MTDTRKNLKIPPELHERITKVAKKNKRTLIAEIDYKFTAPLTKN